MRVALIGPVPPELGGATPGGVATHQMHLAAGMAAVGIDAPLLATNAPCGLIERQHRVDPHPPDPPLPISGRGGSHPYGSYRSDANYSSNANYTLDNNYGLDNDYGSNDDFGSNDNDRSDDNYRSNTYRLYGIGRGWTSFGRMPKYALFLARRAMRGSRWEVLRNLLWYRRFLDEVRPEIIHVQHPLERCLYVRMVQHLEGWHIPLVVTAHSLFGEHAEETIHGLMAPNLRAADRVIAVAEHIAEQAVSLGVPRDRVSVIRSGVDTDRFRPRDRLQARRRLAIGQHIASGIGDDIGNEIGDDIGNDIGKDIGGRIGKNFGEHDPVVLFVGNLEPRKQVDVLLRAMHQVRQRLPNARLFIVGSGQSAGAEDQTQPLLQLRRDLNLQTAVHFAGRVDDQQLLDYYAAANVFALPSSSEAQGIVALEAMACALPVVVTAVGGLLGTIHDGQTGFLVPSGLVEPLAARLVEVLHGTHRAESMGRAARQSVERDFSWSRTVERTIQVYREVLTCARR
jgi:glycosyltransferase involved in cell wall biosynthesis